MCTLQATSQYIPNMVTCSYAASKQSNNLGKIVVAVKACNSQAYVINNLVQKYHCLIYIKSKTIVEN